MDPSLPHDPLESISYESQSDRTSRLTMESSTSTELSDDDHIELHPIGDRSKNMFQRLKDGFLAVKAKIDFETTNKENSKIERLCWYGAKILTDVRVLGAIAITAGTFATGGTLGIALVGIGLSLSVIGACFKGYENFGNMRAKGHGVAAASAVAIATVVGNLLGTVLAIGGMHGASPIIGQTAAQSVNNLINSALGQSFNQWLTGSSLTNLASRSAAALAAIKLPDWIPNIVKHKRDNDATNLGALLMENDQLSPISSFSDTLSPMDDQNILGVTNPSHPLQLDKRVMSAHVPRSILRTRERTENNVMRNIQKMEEEIQTVTQKNSNAKITESAVQRTTERVEQIFVTWNSEKSLSSLGSTELEEEGTKFRNLEPKQKQFVQQRLKDIARHEVKSRGEEQVTDAPLSDSRLARLAKKLIERVGRKDFEDLRKSWDQIDDSANQLVKSVRLSAPSRLQDLVEKATNFLRMTANVGNVENRSFGTEDMDKRVMNSFGADDLVEFSKQAVDRHTCEMRRPEAEAALEKATNSKKGACRAILFAVELAHYKIPMGCDEYSNRLSKITSGLKVGLLAIGEKAGQPYSTDTMVNNISLSIGEANKELCNWSGKKDVSKYRRNEGNLESKDPFGKENQELLTLAMKKAGFDREDQGVLELVKNAYKIVMDFCEIDELLVEVEEEKRENQSSGTEEQEAPEERRNSDSSDISVITPVGRDDDRGRGRDFSVISVDDDD